MNDSLSRAFLVMTCLLVDGDLYEVVIRVSEVQRAYAAHCSTPLHGTLLNLDPTNLERKKEGNITRLHITDYILQYAKGQYLQVCSNCRQRSRCN